MSKEFECAICKKAIHTKPRKKVCSICEDKLKKVVISDRKKWTQLKLNMGENYNG